MMDVSTIDLEAMALAKPKSQSLTVPFAPIRMFWGFMSLCVPRFLVSPRGKKEDRQADRQKSVSKAEARVAHLAGLS